MHGRPLFPFIELACCTNFRVSLCSRFVFDFFFPSALFFRCCLFLYHSVCIIVPLASSYGVFWWHKLFKSYDNKCPEKIAWHAKCIFSIFLTNDIVKTKRCAEVLLMLLELNKVEIFIGHDLFGYSGRHVLHYVNAMINLLQYSCLKAIHKICIIHSIWESAKERARTDERIRSNMPMES